MDKASPIARVVCSPPPHTHCQPTGPGAMQLFGKLRVLHRSSWPASFCYTKGDFHVSVPPHEKSSERGRAARGKLVSVQLPLLVPGRPLLYPSDRHCRLPPVAPCDLTHTIPISRNTQERHLHHRRTILSKEACEQTSRESSSAIETTNQPFNTSTGAGLAL